MKNSRWFLILIAVAVLQTGYLVHAQDEPSAKVNTAKSDSKNELSIQLPTAEQKSPAAEFKVVLSPAAAKPGEVMTVTINAKVAKGWHLNAVEASEDSIGYPTRIEVSSKSLEPIDESFEASIAPETIDVAGQTQKAHSGSFSWTRKYRVGKSEIEKVDGFIQFVACNDQTCLPPKKLAFTLSADSRTRSTIAVAKPQLKTIGDPMAVALEACSLQRPKVKLSLLGMLFGSRKDRLSLKGTLTLGDEKINIYLPDDRDYTLKNSGTGDSRFENNATYISVDQNGDDSIDVSESYASNRPFRVADAMYQITSIDKESAKLTVHEVASPLSGTILGRKVPPFELTTVDGKTITNKSVLGKVTLLDLSAVT